MPPGVRTVVGQAWLQTWPGQAAGGGAGFEVDPLWPKPLPNHWLLGRTIGVWVDEQDHVWIIHRGAATLNANERALELKSRRVLHCRAAGAGVRPGRQPGARGAARAGLRVARVEPRHPRRRQGQRLDRRQRRRRTRRCSSSPSDGKFLMQVGQLGDEHGQQRSRELRPGGEDLGRPEDQRGLHRRRLQQQARRRARCRHRQDEALLGRLRQQAGRRGPRQVRSGCAAGASSSAIRCTASSVANDGLVYVCDRQADRIQVFTPDGKFVQGGVLRASTRSARARRGTSRSRRTRSRNTSTSPTAPTRRCA